MTNAQANQTKVLLQTTEGPIEILLYDDTPLHRDNFVKLVRQGYYDGILFHRVIDQFMVQTGDPDSKNAPKGKMLGTGDPGYEIDAEIVYPRHFHKRGALAAARTGDQVNPQRRSSGSQFYIVTGKAYTEAQLQSMARQRTMQHQQEIFDSLVTQNRDTIMALRRARDTAALQQLQEQLQAQTIEASKADGFVPFTPEQTQAYTTQGGTPHLDGAYTVFGEIISGMETVDKISQAETDHNDRPVNDIRILSAKVLE